MSLTWRGEPVLALGQPGAGGYARALLRGLPLLALLATGLALTITLQVIERPLCHPRRPVSPWIPVLVCRGALRLLTLRVTVFGAPMRGPGALVANHSSWLDIVVLNAQGPVTFISKAEVASWPVIGLLARAAGTIFIRREARAEALQQARAVAEALAAGRRLLFFPEGTSTDNRRVLAFKPALFAGLFVPDLREDLRVQPVTVAYESPPGQDPRFYTWFGDADLGPHLLAVLASRRGGHVRLIVHPPIPVAGRDRKSLASETEAAVRSAL